MVIKSATKETTKRAVKGQELESSEAAFLLMWRTKYPDSSYGLSYDPHDLVMPFDYSGRKFKSDFVHVGARVAIEIQGGIHGGSGKHGRGAGIIVDMQKLAIAQRNGWALLQVPAFAKESFWFDSLAELIHNRQHFEGEF